MVHWLFWLFLCLSWDSLFTFSRSFQIELFTGWIPFGCNFSLAFFESKLSSNQIPTFVTVVFLFYLSCFYKHILVSTCFSQLNLFNLIQQPLSVPCKENIICFKWFGSGLVIVAALFSSSNEVTEHYWNVSFLLLFFLQDAFFFFACQRNFATVSKAWNCFQMLSPFP